jgi:hypothetical protein
MSVPDSAPRPTQNRLDQFNLPPPRRRIVRGIVRNIRVSHVEAAFGPLEIIDFDLFVSESQPPVPVQMRGNDFSHPLFEGSLVDTADPDPSVRPLQTRRLVYPHHPNQDCIAYYPGLDDPNSPKDRMWTIVTIASPIIGAAVLGALIGWYFGLFH